MVTPRSRKVARIDVRVRPDIKERIEKAANISGQTMTDFAISALGKTADEVLEQHHVTELSDRDRDIFLSILDKKSKPNAQLIRASKRHGELIVE